MMDEKLARHVGRVAFEASARLGELVPLLKEHCSDRDEYIVITRAIAAAITAIDLEILNLLFKNFPELKHEFDESIKTYRRIL
jgi:hypothetical protein